MERGDFGMVEIGDDEVMAIATAVVNKYYLGERALRRDLIGESVVGVLKACASYREDSGCKFSTYAYKCAKNEVATYMRRERKWRGLQSDKEVDFEDILVGGVIDDGAFLLAQDGIDKLRVIEGRFKSERDKAIMRDILSGKKRSLIAEEFGVSKQSISRVFVKMKRLARGAFRYEDGEVIER